MSRIIDDRNEREAEFQRVAEEARQEFVSLWEKLHKQGKMDYSTNATEIKPPTQEEMERAMERDFALLKKD